MNLRDLKSLNSIISEVTKPETQDKSRMIQEGFGNSLTAKARQVVDEQVEGSRGPRPMVPVKKVTPPSGNVRKEADRIKRDGQAEVDRLARKALKRAKRKAATNEEAELDLAEGVDAKRMRLLHKHHVSGKPMTGKVADWMQRSFKKKFEKNKTKFGGETSAVLGKARLKYSAMKAKGLAESEQLDEAGYKRLMRIKKAAYKADLASRKMNPKTAKQDIELNRLVNKHGKLGRVAAERTAQVAAGFARRGGASDDAVRGGGSIVGKSGKYTQKAATLAKQRDKGLANFRNLVVDRGVSRDTGVGPVKAMGDRLKYKKPQMTPDQVAKKRKDQAAMREFRNRARSGDFGQNNQEGMRPRYNYLKRTGKLKTKTK